MKIRLMGTREETGAAVPVLRELFEVYEVSGFRTNRGNSKLGRVYVEVGAVRPAPAPGPVHATAERVDTPRPALGDGTYRIGPGQDRHQLR